MSQVETAQIFKSLRRIVRAIDLRSREVARVSGLTIPQIVVLQGIHELGEVTTKALSEHADLSSATVVTILDKLELKGLVQRYRSATDRRIVHAKLTSAGEVSIRSLPGLLHEEFEEKFSRLPSDQRKLLIGALAEIAEMMNAHTLDAAPILTTETIAS